jgi:hypothetical protein
MIFMGVTSLFVVADEGDFIIVGVGWIDFGWSAGRWSAGRRSAGGSPAMSAKREECVKAFRAWRRSLQASRLRSFGLRSIEPRFIGLLHRFAAEIARCDNESLSKMTISNNERGFL